MREGKIQVSTSSEEEQIAQLRKAIIQSQENKAWQKKITQAHQVADYEEFKNEKREAEKIVQSNPDIGFGNLPDRVKNFLDSVEPQNKRKIAEAVNSYYEDPEKLEAFISYLNTVEENQDWDQAIKNAKILAERREAREQTMRDKTMNQFTPSPATAPTNNGLFSKIKSFFTGK